MKLLLKHTFTGAQKCEIARPLLVKNCVIHSSMLNMRDRRQLYIICNLFGYLGFFHILVDGKHLKDVILNRVLVPERTT